MTAAASVPLRLVTCRSDCPDGPGVPHHDRLLAVDTDTSVLLELIELAVTWHELDYSTAEVVPPREWERFAERHRWADPARAEWAFLLATDIVRRGRPRGGPALPGSD
jgi:hypothetical protein